MQKIAFNLWSDLFWRLFASIKYNTASHIQTRPNNHILNALDFYCIVEFV